MKLKKFLSLLLSAAMAFSLLTATAFAAAPAEEENGFFDFLLGEKYTYLYAALTWDEYWANEKVYAAGSTASSAQLDSHEEQDLGAFDAVSRATVNHGLHRGSYQCTVKVFDTDGNSYDYTGKDYRAMDMINFAVASSAIKHTIHGDANITDDVTILCYALCCFPNIRITC